MINDYIFVSGTRTRTRTPTRSRTSTPARSRTRTPTEITNQDSHKITNPNTESLKISKPNAFACAILLFSVEA